MKRKVVKHGPSTLTISLPSKWCRENKVEEGDDLEIIEKGDNIKIYTGSTINDRKKIKILYPDTVDFLKRVIINLYRKGYDEIEIDSKVKIPRSRISSKMMELLGYEVVEHTEKKLIIKNLTVPKENEFELVFRRLYRLNYAFASEVYQAISAKDSDLTEIAQMDKEINKLYNLCVRTLNENQSDMHKSYVHLQTLNYLEQIGDQLDEVCSDFTNNKIEFSNSVINLFEHIITYFELIYQINFDFNYKKLLLAEKHRENLFNKIKSLLRSQKGSDVVLLTYLYVILESLFHIENYLLNVEDNLAVK